MPGRTSGVDCFQPDFTAAGPIFPFRETKFFQEPVMKGNGVAASAGTANAVAMSQYGALNAPYSGNILWAHLHQTVDGNSGSNVLELYRLRGAVFTQVASISLTLGVEGDFHQASWTVTDATFQAGDYFYMQATTVGTAGTPVGTVDLHLEYTGA